MTQKEVLTKTSMMIMTTIPVRMPDVTRVMLMTTVMILMTTTVLVIMMTTKLT